MMTRIRLEIKCDTSSFSTQNDVISYIGLPSYKRRFAMRDQPVAETSAAVANLRSGTAARLAGLPVTTLRVWERRYGVVNAAKSETGRRMYSQHDVVRLRVLRQLTSAGHAIGPIAKLDLAALQAIARGLPDLPSADVEKAINVVVVGRSAVPALEAARGIVLIAVHEDLKQAEHAQATNAPVDVLLFRLSSLQPSSVDRVLSLSAASKAAAILVVYEFGTEISARSLREAGVSVRREPVSNLELAHWVRTVPFASPPPPPVDQARWRTEPRQFDDQALALLTEASSSITCECLRHMAEIVRRLSAFERYSQECVSANSADADLHRKLGRTSGVARTMFEAALRTVVDERGLAQSLAPPGAKWPSP